MSWVLKNDWGPNHTLIVNTVNILTLTIILYQLYEDEDYQLIMNAKVGKEANIWSPEARSFIRDQVQLYDKVDEKSRGKSYNKLFQGIKYHESCLKELNPENDPLPLV